MTLLEELNNSYNKVYKEFEEYYKAFKIDSKNIIPDFTTDLPFEIISGVLVKFFDDRCIRISITYNYYSGTFEYTISNTAVNYISLLGGYEKREGALNAALLTAADIYATIYINK